MKKKITISIDERILKELQQIARYENRSVSNYIEQTVYKTFSKALQEIILKKKEVE